MGHVLPALYRTFTWGVAKTGCAMVEVCPF